MTENMAGRGEGLAGLVAEHDPQLYSPQGPVSGVNGTYTIAFLGCSCGWNSGGEASKTQKWSEHVVRALEAAAPAGTAQTEYLIKRARVWSEADLRSFPTATLELIDALAAALATPSPQAPTCPTCRGERTIMTKPAGAGHSDDLAEYEWCPDCAAAERIRDMVAGQAKLDGATQEPAGSGASNLSMCGVPMEIMGCFICQGEVKNWCPTHGNGAAAPGSPRKVGEDGPSAQEIRLGVHLQHCNFGEYPNACKYGDDDCPALTESWSWFGKTLERAARSSSVPVGEQKEKP